MFLRKLILVVLVLFISGCLPAPTSPGSSVERMSLKAFNRSASLVDESLLKSLGCEFKLLKKIGLLEFQLAPVSEVLRVECDNYRNVNFYSLSIAVNEYASLLAEEDFSKEGYAVQVAAERKMHYLKQFRIKMYGLKLKAEACFEEGDSLASLFSCNYFEKLDLDAYDKSDLSQSLLVFRYIEDKNLGPEGQYDDLKESSRYKSMKYRYEILMNKIDERNDPLELFLNNLKGPGGRVR